MIDSVIGRELKSIGARGFANDNISCLVTADDLDEMERKVAYHVRAILAALEIDTEEDHNTKDTAKRVAKMYVQEVFAGRYAKPPAVTTFPNDKNAAGIITVGPITVRSACSHHLVPIIGECWIGCIPGETLIGLSKFNRLAEWVFARPQIQEEATEQLAAVLQEAFDPVALAVVVRARHMCCEWRGVKDGSKMGTSVLRGHFFDNHDARQELFAILRSQGF